MIVGMDFGTTNSGMAVYDGRSVQVLPLDPANPNPRVIRTALYITNDQSIHIGRTAVDEYFNQNIGRPVKMQRVWVGEFEVFGADMYYVNDAYAWIDALSPGRLFLSVKTSLRDREYPGTVVGQHFYSLENLIALYLSVNKLRAEQLLGQELRQVVLGRPVRFSLDPKQDRLAEARLLQAAFKAGYEKVYLQYEPIAAAFNYETTLNREQHVLTFDFGGGTLDVTIMRLGDRKRRQVLATGGIPVAGDVFDQKLVRAKLPRHFGEGSAYGPRRKQLTVPQWIYDAFSDWQTILELQSNENKEILREIAQSARRRYQIEALESLVSSNYGLKMFDIVERAKRRLSEKRGAEIRLKGPGFDVREFVTRTEFENIIRTEIRAIEDHLLETVANSGLEPEEIDAVIRTGGSAQIPVFYEMLCRMFGEEKVHSTDTFSSVTAGLGVIGHGVAAGELDLPAYTPEMVQPPQVAGQTRANVPPVNLDLLQRRLLLEEGEITAVPDDAPGWIFLGESGGITAVPAPAALEPAPLTKWGVGEQTRQVLAAPLSDQVLLITSKYRFLLTTVRQLIDLQQMEMAITDVYQLEAREVISALAHWDTVKEAERLVLATSLGFVRPFPMDVLQSSIEAPVPLRFDHPLPGVPLAALPGGDDAHLLLMTESGRGIRWPLSRLRIAGVQVVNCGSDDRVCSVALTTPAAEALLLTADGYGRRLQVAWVDIPPKANQKGRSLIARRSRTVSAVPSTGVETIWCVTSQRLLPVPVDAAPLADSSRTVSLLKLDSDETVCAVFPKTELITDNRLRQRQTRFDGEPE